MRNVLALGFFLSLVPVAAALQLAIDGFQKSATLGEQALHETSRRMDLVRSALQRVNDIERKARLLVLLSDPKLSDPYDRNSYENVRQLFQKSLNDLLSNAALDSKLALIANELLEKERLIHRYIVGEFDASPRVPLDDAFRGLREVANRLWEEVNGKVDSQVLTLQALSQSLEREIWYRTTLLVGAVSAFFFFLALLVSRTLARLGQALERLTDGHLGEPIGVGGTTELRLLGNRLECLRIKLSDLEKAKQHYTHNTSVKLGRALTVIHEAVEELESELARVGSRRASLLCTRLSKHLGHLHAIADDLVRFDPGEERHATPGEGRQDLKNILEAVLDTYRPRLDEKSLRVMTLAQSIVVDSLAETFREIFSQLIDNAIKFSPPEGEIRLVLRESDNIVEFEVEDDGPGFQGDDANEFRALPAAGRALRNPRSTASGGLAIVSGYLDSCFGDLTIFEPDPRQSGARLRVSIPLDSAG